jgi:predicted esterase
VPTTVYRIDRDRADRLLFLLHGYSAEQHHLAAYVPLVDPGERFGAVCPRALHDLPEGDGASWWTRTPTGPDPDSIRQAVAAVEDLVTAETAARGIDRRRCVIGGFSQGGMLALAVATAAGAERFGGVWAMCCARPDPAVVTVDPADAAGTPALIQYGTSDPIIDLDRGTAAAGWLGTAGWDVTLRGYDMGHSQTIEMMVDARTWLAGLTGRG